MSAPLEEEEASVYVVAPCKGNCGVEIEDEGPVDDNWYCTQCWPPMELARLRYQVVERDKEIERLRRLYDEETKALDLALRRAVQNERRLESALKEAHAIDVDTLVDRQNYIVRLETALRLIVKADRTDEVLEAERRAGKRVERTGWESPRVLARAALDVPRRRART